MTIIIKKIKDKTCFENYVPDAIIWFEIPRKEMRRAKKNIAGYFARFMDSEGNEVGSLSME